MNKISQLLSHRTIVWMLFGWIMIVTAIDSLPASYAATTTANISTSRTTSVSSQAVRTQQVRALVAIALENVENIRALISQNKKDRLLPELLQLKTNFKLIEATRPMGEIDALIRFYQQHLSLEHTRQVLADIMPLYQALSMLPSSKESDLARKQLDRVKTNLEEGKHADAVSALEEMQRTLSIDRVDLPLQAAEEKLNTITNLYQDKKEIPEYSVLLGLETDFMQILAALS